MATEVAPSILDQLDGMEQEAGTGRGVFTKVTIQAGYKTFRAGIPLNIPTLVTYDPADKEAEKKAKEQVEAIVTAAGGDPTSNKDRATKVIAYECSAADVIGGAWKSDLTKLIPTWTDSWAKRKEKVEGVETTVFGVAQQAIRDLAAAGKFTGFGKSYFAHVHVMRDPSGRQDNNKQVVTIWYVDEIYPTVEAMRAAADAAGAAASAAGEACPDGYTPELWAQFKPKVIAALGTAPTPPVLAQVAKDYGLTVDFLQTVKG